MPKTVQRDEGHAPFGAWLVAQRKAQRWTQAELAARLGYSESVVQRWEQGHILPLRWQVAELVQAFGAKDHDAQAWYWRAGYVPPTLWGLVDGLPEGSTIALAIRAARAGPDRGASA